MIPARRLNALSKHPLMAGILCRQVLVPGRRFLWGSTDMRRPAEEELRRLRAIPGIGRWTVVSVEGLHQFYRRRTNEVVASWMTRQNRELLIADNTAYISQVIRRVAEDFSPGAALVTPGFPKVLPWPIERPPLWIVRWPG